MKILAKADYKQIKSFNAGLYLWVNPSQVSTLKILRLLHNAPFKTYSSTELHCTVLYSKDIVEKLDLPDDRVCTGYITEILSWQDHKDRTIFVASVDSDDLVLLHNQVVAQGLNHSYPEFNPHITLAKDVDVSDQKVKLWLDYTNSQLALKPLKIAFSSMIRGSPVL